METSGRKRKRTAIPGLPRRSSGEGKRINEVVLLTLDLKGRRTRTN